jgi:hypothetical protein
VAREAAEKEVTVMSFRGSRAIETIGELDDAELGWRSTDPNAPLDALVRRLSQMMEEIFDRTGGGVDMSWLVESPQGQQGP